MIRPFLCSVLLPLLAVLVVPVAYAQQQYWVTVGSFKSAATAEEVREQVSTDLAEPFTVVGAQTDAGYFYRVAAGPYSIDLARDSLAAAKSGGFTQAWMWSADAFADQAITSIDVNDDDFGDDYSSDLDLSDYSSDFDASFEEPLFDDDEPLSAETELIERREPPPSLVEEPPPGYQLHKLRRDA